MERLEIKDLKRRIAELEKLVFALGDKLLIVSQKLSVIAERKEMRNRDLLKERRDANGG